MSARQLPLVSVVIPMFNAAPFIRDTLESIMSQTYPSWEIVVVDDGSTDQSADIVREIRNRWPLQIFLITQENAGVSQARNAGIAAAHGEYVAFLDADDLWDPRKLDLQLKTLSSSDCTLGVGCWYTMSPLSGNGRNVLVKASWDRRAIREWALLEGRGPLLPSTLLLRREVLSRVGNFNPTLSTAADLDFGLRLAAIGNIDCVEASLVTYRLQSHQMHRDLVLLRKDLHDLVEHSDYLSDRRDKTRIEVGLELLNVARELQARQLGASLLKLVRLFFTHPNLVTSTIVRRSLLRMKSR